MARIHRVRNRYANGDPTFQGVNFYGLYATAKAYHLALNPLGVPTPITLVDDDTTDGVPAWDWYRNDPPAGAPASAGPIGLARAVIGNQVATGQFPGNASSPTHYWSGNMSTAWGVIMLSPTLFQLGPTAVCSVNPSQIGQNGGTVTFDGTGSFHNDEEGQIVSYSWSFGDATNGSGAIASHTYPSRASFPFTYNATLTVTDSNGLTDTTSCPVTQVNTNVAPDANAGGPYAMCMGGPLVLNGTGSHDEETADANLTFKWDWTAPLNFASPDAVTPTVDVAAIFQGKGPGTYDIGLQVTDDN